MKYIPGPGLGPGPHGRQSYRIHDRAGALLLLLLLLFHPRPLLRARRRYYRRLNRLQRHRCHDLA